MATDDTNAGAMNRVSMPAVTCSPRPRDGGFEREVIADSRYFCFRIAPDYSRDFVSTDCIISTVRI
jgi:hypothetical protein